MLQPRDTQQKHPVPLLRTMFLLITISILPADSCLGAYSSRNPPDISTNLKDRRKVGEDGSLHSQNPQKTKAPPLWFPLL